MIEFHLAIEDYKRKKITDEKLKQHADRWCKHAKSRSTRGLFE